MVQSEMKAEGKDVSIKKLCKWLDVARSSVYYELSRAFPMAIRPLDPFLTQKANEVMEENPAYGVRRITAVIRRNLQKAIHRILKTNGWQIRKKSSGFKKRAQTMTSQLGNSNERCAIDATTIFCGVDGWSPLTAIIDCHDRCIVGWGLSISEISKHAAACLEDSLRGRKEEFQPG